MTNRLTALERLMKSAPAGRYTLPSEVLDAWAVYEATKGRACDEGEVLDVHAAASKYLAAVAAGEPAADALDLARRVEEGKAHRAAVNTARDVLAIAVEQAAGQAATVAAEQADAIIVEHLAPAFEQLLDEARKVAAALNGYDRGNPHVLAVAPARVREAFAALPGLAERWGLLWKARGWINSVSGVHAQYDAEGRFVELASPVALVPGWKPTSPLPRVGPPPTEPVERLLWIASDEAKPGHPWFPTPLEQDEAWCRVFKADQKMRQQRAHDAHALGSALS